MDLGLKDKRVLLTGGTKGIGRAAVLALAAEGASVITCHTNTDESAASLAKELGDGHEVVRADVTGSADVVRLVERARARFGGLDVLVNNVGTDGVVWFGELSETEWHRVVDHNVTAAYLVTQAALELLADGASVINIGSATAMRGRIRGVHYTASKAALIGMTRALCKELGHRGIRVNTIAPGLTATESDNGLSPDAVKSIVARTALGRICRPEDVANAVAFLAGDAADYISGATLNVDGGV